jgi:hypothetical protein
MATITYTKQYEFCDDIKAHILSYLKPRKMKSFTPSIQLLQKMLEWKRSTSALYNNPRRFHYTSPLYHIRMNMPYRQLEYEVSEMGANARKKHERDYVNTLYAGARWIYDDAMDTICGRMGGLKNHLASIRMRANEFAYRRDECEKYIKFSKRVCCRQCKKTMTYAKYVRTDHSDGKCKRTHDVVKPTKTYSVAETYKRELIECVKCYEKFQRKSMPSHIENCEWKNKRFNLGIGTPKTHTLW